MLLSPASLLAGLSTNHSVCKYDFILPGRSAVLRLWVNKVIKCMGVVREGGEGRGEVSEQKRQRKLVVMSSNFGVCGSSWVQCSSE